MKGDFSRNGFDPAKHYLQILMQQGRILTDADANENSSVLLHRLRWLTRDLFGAHGGPADSGFGLEVEMRGEEGALLFLTAGRYYVEGLPCQNELRVEYLRQPDYLPVPNDDLRRWLKRPEEDVSFFVYLDVWERWVSALEDPGIADPALGGLDASGRSKLVWQAKAARWDLARWGEPATGLDAALKALSGPPPGRLMARVAPTASAGGLGGRFTGSEDALYRIEVHAPGAPGTATFKWSRNNASSVSRWLGSQYDVGTHHLLVESSNAFAVGDCVELVHDGLELTGHPGTLVRVVDRGADKLEVQMGVGREAGLAWSPEWTNAKVRRWHQGQPGQSFVDGALMIVASENTPTWIGIDGGLQVAFELGGMYRSGDYWLIPARVTTASILWPSTPSKEEPFHAPAGIAHSLAPLGLIGCCESKVSVLQDYRKLRKS